MTTTKPKKRKPTKLGGARPGAGRKAGSGIYGESASNMYVPTRLKPKIHQFIIKELGIPDPLKKRAEGKHNKEESHDGNSH